MTQTLSKPLTTDDEIETHICMPVATTFVEFSELEFIGVGIYEDDVGVMWCIAHSDEEYDLIQKVVDAHG